MLTRLNVDFELEEIDLSDKPRDFVELSPTGKVPMIVEDDFVLYESQVINDYLVDRHGWEDAYPEDLRLEYRHKVAMKQWDGTVLEPVYASLADDDALAEHWGDIEPELEYLADVVSVTESTDNLLAFHLAPFWARFQWLSEYTDFPDRVRGIDGLAGWLDSTLEEEPVRGTLPDRDWAVKQYEKNYVD